MREWYYAMPGDGMAAGPIYGDTEAEARAYIREWYGIDRLPKGTQVWEKPKAEAKELQANYEQYQRGVPAWARGPL